MTKRKKSFKIILVLIFLKSVQVTTPIGNFLTSEGKGHPFSTFLYHIASKRHLRLYHLTITSATI